VLGLSQASVDSRLLVLPGPYYWHVIGMFNTYSRGPTQRSLTNTAGGYNHLGAPPGLRLSNINIASSECDVRPIAGLVFRPLDAYRGLYVPLAMAKVTQILTRSSRVTQKVFIM
jgi:hypothetical protein